MKISQKFENACRVLLQLAQHFDGETVTRLETLAQREHVSSSFLVQILNELRRSGLVESRRGKTGGYLLARPPADISLYEIAAAIEPALVDDSAGTDGESGQAFQKTWNQASEVFANHLKGTSLASMQKDETPMYFI